MAVAVSTGAKAAHETRGTRPARTIRVPGALTGWLFVVPALAFMVIFFGYPLFYNISMSLRRYTAASFVTGDAPFIGLQNYRNVIGNSIFSSAVVHTAIFTLGCIILEFAIGLALALYFNQRFRLSSLLRSLLMLPWLVPIIVSGTIYRWIYNAETGVINQTLTELHLISKPIPWLTDPHWAMAAVMLANIWIGIPFNLAILYSGLQAIPRDLYEAAHVDGAGRVRSFIHVTLPGLRPVIAIVLTLSLIYTLKVFDLIWITTMGGPGNGTQTLSTYAYSLSFQNLQFGQGAAVGSLLLLVAGLFAVVYVATNRNPD